VSFKRGDVVEYGSNNSRYIVVAVDSDGISDVVYSLQLHKVIYRDHPGQWFKPIKKGVITTELERLVYGISDF
jgi:hypothetical protein